ncbi:MAG TPA: hypothetical protein VKV15_28205 [Bryobacteraceae bacterium]|nr:hypothetical protein [Bryobacteraceae bacterium]
MDFRTKLVLGVIVLLLIVARFAIRRQAGKRAEMLKSVPRRPLGLTDDSSDRK